MGFGNGQAMLRYHSKEVSARPRSTQHAARVASVWALLHLLALPAPCSLRSLASAPVFCVCTLNLCLHLRPVSALCTNPRLALPR